MRSAYCCAALILGACASAPTDGPLDEGMAGPSSITAVDSAHPPKSASVTLDREAWVVLLLVAPGHSATLLYPRDSTTDNRMTTGAHELAFEVPAPLVRVDSLLQRRARERAQIDTTSRVRSRRATSTLPPLTPTTPTYLLLVTSPQPLVWARVIEKTAGWSIPLDDHEALNAVAKSVKASISREPREVAGFFKQVTLVAERK